MKMHIYNGWVGAVRVVVIAEATNTVLRTVG